MPRRDALSRLGTAAINWNSNVAQRLGATIMGIKGATVDPDGTKAAESSALVCETDEQQILGKTVLSH